MNLATFATALNFFLAIGAGGGGEGGEQPGPGAFLLPLVLTIGIMYFLLFRPQQKRAAEHKKFQESLKKGDHVLTNSGIYARVWAIEDKIVTLEIAKNVHIKVTRESISGRGRTDETKTQEEKNSQKSKN